MRTTSSILAGALLYVVRAANTSSQAAPCCNALSQSSLPVFFPNTTSYANRLDDYWSVSAALSPWCMVLPESSKDVSLVMQTLTKYQCPFGITGGGHGAFALSNSVEDGVTIDFAYLNGTTYNKDTNIASVAPGSHWQDVYETLAPHGVCVAGGRAGTVGVGGFVSGGGNNFYAGSHGFGCDTVQNFEVVLANGSVVDANAEENADLWVALKGGSGNFGLITRFDMYAIAFAGNSTNIWGGILKYDLNASEAVIEAYVDFTDNIVNDQNSSVIIYWIYNEGMTLAVDLANTINVQAPAFDALLSIDGIVSNTLTSEPMANITEEDGEDQPSGYRNDWFTGAYQNDARIITYAVAQYEKTLAALNATMSADSGFNTIAMFQPLPQITIEHGVANGGNVMGLDAAQRIANSNGTGNGVLFLVTFAVDGAANEATALPLLQGLVDRVDAYATSLGANWNWRYLNYAYRTQDPIASFGDAAKAKIRAASDKYDPDQVFQKLRRSGMKIPA